MEMPALIVELKWSQDVNQAMAQMKEKGYSKVLEDYAGKILLVGISYDKITKKHSCKIEQWEIE